MAAARKFLESSHAAMLVTDKPVVSVNGSATLEDVFRTIVANNVTAVPVCDEKTHRFVGFLQTSDLLADIVEFCSLFTGDFSEFQQEFGHFQEFLDALSHDRAVDVLAIAARHPYKAVRPAENLMSVFRALIADETSRIAIEDRPGHALAIVTQSSIVKLVHAQQAVFAELLQTTVQASAFGIKPVVSVSEDQPLVEGLKLMHAHGLSALAVVDAEGALLTTLTTSDVRAVLSRSNFCFFQLTVMQFVQLSRNTQLKDSPGALVVFPETPLSGVISLLASSGRHRVFVVDGTTRAPCGVITLRDVMAYILALPAMA